MQQSWPQGQALSPTAQGQVGSRDSATRPQTGASSQLHRCPWASHAHAWACSPICKRMISRLRCSLGTTPQERPGGHSHPVPDSRWAALLPSQAEDSEAPGSLHKQPPGHRMEFSRLNADSPLLCCVPSRRSCVPAEKGPVTSHFCPSSLLLPAQGSVLASLSVRSWHLIGSPQPASSGLCARGQKLRGVNWEGVGSRPCHHQQCGTWASLPSTPPANPGKTSSELSPMLGATVGPPPWSSASPNKSEVCPGGQIPGHRHSPQAHSEKHTPLPTGVGHPLHEQVSPGVLGPHRGPWASFSLPFATSEDHVQGPSSFPGASCPLELPAQLSLPAPKKQICSVQPRAGGRETSLNWLCDPKHGAFPL